MTRIDTVCADITTLAVDAVVNAANTFLQHGGGVAAAISRAGGPIIQRASDEWIRVHGPLQPGTAAITPAGAMPARLVIHVAGPVYTPDAENAALLNAAITAALEAASDHSCLSVALPAISAGIYGYPAEDATRIIAAAAKTWCAAHPGVLETVLLVGRNQDMTAAFDRAVAI